MASFRWPWKNTPACLNRAAFPALAGMVVMSVYTVSQLLLWKYRNPALGGEYAKQTGPFGSAAVLLLIYAFAVGALMWSLWRQWRMRRAARLASSLLCPRCCYDLSTLADNGSCPECGRSYTHEDCREAWKPHLL